MVKEDKKGSEGSGASRSRYIWDPNKLAWVETTAEEPVAVKPIAEKPVKEKPSVTRTPHEERIAEPAYEEAPPDKVVAQTALAEAVGETEFLQYRGAWLRLAALIVDFIILTIIMVIIGQVTSYPSWTAVIVGLVYFVGFWAWRGQTPGKMIIGARIVKTDGSKITFVNALLRYAFYLIPSFAPIIFLSTGIGWIGRNVTIIVILFGIIGMLVIGFSRNKRGIHDLIAGTCVINTRRGFVQPRTMEPIEASESDESPDKGDTQQVK